MITLNCRYSIVWRLPANAWRAVTWYDTPADSLAHAERLAVAALAQGSDVVEIRQHAPFERTLQTLTADCLEAA